MLVLAAGCQEYVLSSNLERMLLGGADHVEKLFQVRIFSCFSFFRKAVPASLNNGGGVNV